MFLQAGLDGWTVSLSLPCMTRAGEKLYGDWEQRIRDRARPHFWMSVLKNGATLLLAIGMLVVALFGFS